MPIDCEVNIHKQFRGQNQSVQLKINVIMFSASEAGRIKRRKSMYVDLFYGETLTLYPFTFIILNKYSLISTQLCQSVEKLEKKLACN